VARSNSKKSFYHYKSDKKINKEKVGLLLNRDLVKMCVDKPERNPTFASVFTDRISWAFEPRQDSRKKGFTISGRGSSQGSHEKF